MLASIGPLLAADVTSGCAASHSKLSATIKGAYDLAKLLAEVNQKSPASKAPATSSSDNRSTRYLHCNAKEICQVVVVMSLPVNIALPSIPEHIVMGGLMDNTSNVSGGMGGLLGGASKNVGSSCSMNGDAAFSCSPCCSNYCLCSYDGRDKNSRK
jgi:hypothetical protein